VKKKHTPAPLPPKEPVFVLAGTEFRIDDLVKVRTPELGDCEAYVTGWSKGVIGMPEIVTGSHTLPDGQLVGFRIIERADYYTNEPKLSITALFDYKPCKPYKRRWGTNVVFQNGVFVCGNSCDYVEPRQFVLSSGVVKVDEKPDETAANPKPMTGQLLLEL